MIDGENTPDTLNARHGNGQVVEVEPHVTHVLPGERELLAECHRHQLYLAICGAELQSSLCEPECGRPVTYCPDCLYDALRCNADAGLVWSPPGTCS